MSQAEVARQLGISQPAISLIERGSPVGLNEDNIKELLNILDFSDFDIPQQTIGLKPPGNRLFISYSHRDKEYLDRLLVHLRPLQRADRIDAWVDTKIAAGDRWKDAITDALEEARGAVLLVSADFLASDFIVDNELPPLLRSAEENGTTILPVIVKPCRFLRDENLNKYQAVNPPEEPISGMDTHGRELVYDSVSQRIESLFSEEDS